MKGRIFARLNDIGLRNKILGSFMLVLVIPLLVVGIVLMLAFREATLADSLRQTEAAVDRIAFRTSEVLSTAINVGNQLSTDEKLKSLVSHQYNSTLEVFLAYRSYESFRLYRNIISEVQAIRLYVENPTLIDNWEFMVTDLDTRMKFWYQQGLANRDKSAWFFFPDIARHPGSTLSMVRNIRLPDLPQDGVAVLDINTESLGSLLKVEPFSTYLVDSLGMVAASSEEDRVGAFLSIPGLLETMQNNPKASLVMAINGVPNQVFVRTISSEWSINKIHLVSHVALDLILEDANRISLIGLGLMGGIVLLALTLISFIYSTLAQRLLNLSASILAVSRGELGGKIPVDGRDEIGLISAQFNTMVDNISTLIEQVRQAEELQSRLVLSQKEIRFKMLASQINPHFLYNVLESVRMKALMSGEKDIARIVKQLGKLMRKNLSAGEGPISIAEELENVRTYLDIEKFRMGDLLDYTVDMDPGLESMMIPPLIIEPLVENAVIHGISPLRGGGKLAVTGRIDGGWGLIMVKDNGGGIPPHRLKQIIEGLEGPDGQHIGLANIHQRLLMLFGTASGLNIQSTEGTLISFRIPLEDDHVSRTDR